MASHIISRRIQYIIQFVYDYDFPSKRDILDFLKDKDFNLSARTLERDIERIRTDFGIELSYNKECNGYFVDQEKSVKVESFFKFLEIAAIADIFSESLNNSNKILNYVSFDDSKNFKGIDNLKDILIAIDQKKMLHFIHENFEKKTHNEYDITPFLLKEYENRWYVIGVPFGKAEIRTFGIDRISNLRIGKFSKLDINHYSSQIDKFRNIIGIHIEDGNPIDVSILVDGLHIKYMRSLPLHHSQVIHPINKEGKHRVGFFLIPNYEFMTQILKMGDEAVVISPEKLKNEIKDILASLMEKYI
jgi:predicted DNA-binding transcriptional regulator YafY